MEDQYKIASKTLKVAEGLRGLTSLSMARGKDVAKKKFLVELEEGLFKDLDSATTEEGISRNLGGSHPN